MGKRLSKFENLEAATRARTAPFATRTHLRDLPKREDPLGVGIAPYYGDAPMEMESEVYCIQTLQSFKVVMLGWHLPYPFCPLLFIS